MDPVRLAELSVEELRERFVTREHAAGPEILEALKNDPRAGAGVDEAGMSPLAGPVVAGAVILARGEKIAGVDDSKVLDEPTREALVLEVKARAVCWAVGVVSHEEIDRINIYRAGLLAMKR